VHIFAEGPHGGNGFGTQAWSSAKADKVDPKIVIGFR
jgi:hypothetical protein